MRSLNTTSFLLDVKRNFNDNNGKLTFLYISSFFFISKHAIFWPSKIMFSSLAIFLQNVANWAYLVFSQALPIVRAKFWGRTEIVLE